MNYPGKSKNRSQSYKILEGGGNLELIFMRESTGNMLFEVILLHLNCSGMWEYKEVEKSRVWNMGPSMP